MAEHFEPTEREEQAVNVLGTAWACLGFAALVFGNVTGSWWGVGIIVLVGLATVVGLTAWSARTRGQGWWATFRQINRRVFSRRRSEPPGPTAEQEPAP